MTLSDAAINALICFAMAGFVLWAMWAQGLAGATV
jgi:hypothetical protein